VPARSALIKLTPGVDLTNYLQAALTKVDPKSTKKTVKSSAILRFWDLCAKAARRMLMKLTPGVDFINFLRTAFTREEPKCLK